MNSLLIFVIHEINGALFFNINGLFFLSLITFPCEVTVIVPLTNIYASS